MELKTVAKRISPPIIVDGGLWVRRKLGGRLAESPEWEHVPEGWSRRSNDPNIKGWNVPSVLEAYKAKWPAFVDAVKGTGPLGISHEGSQIRSDDCSQHNIVMCYAYVLALASRNKERISMMDWGGGIGHYYLLGKAILDDEALTYHCRDLPILVDHGRSLFPEAYFYDDDSCLESRYDLVVSSSSLQYSEDWSDVLRRLIDATEHYLYVTRIPVLSNSPSFVVLQRAYKYGYDTEYLGWFFNRDELVQCASEAGMDLVREFDLGSTTHVQGAPEDGRQRGFLFQPASQSSR